VITWQNVSPNTVELCGELSQRSVTSLMPINSRIDGHSGELNVELAKLAHVDTAGLAFLIELQQCATQHQISLNFSGSTMALDKLISLYNAQSLFTQ